MWRFWKETQCLTCHIVTRLSRLRDGKRVTTLEHFETLIGQYYVEFQSAQSFELWREAGRRNEGETGQDVRRRRITASWSQLVLQAVDAAILLSWPNPVDSLSLFFFFFSFLHLHTWKRSREKLLLFLPKGQTQHIPRTFPFFSLFLCLFFHRIWLRAGGAVTKGHLVSDFGIFYFFSQKSVQNNTIRSKNIIDCQSITDNRRKWKIGIANHLSIRRLLLLSFFSSRLQTKNQKCRRVKSGGKWCGHLFGMVDHVSFVPRHLTPSVNRATFRTRPFHFFFSNNLSLGPSSRPFPPVL